MKAITMQGIVVKDENNVFKELEWKNGQTELKPALSNICLEEVEDAAEF